ncbi:MAG: hypothetical protein L3K23_10670 [Thermoplasmata archaeon]|nr:hypothetical protein [Thermoplasmata archaeon]
MPGGAYSVWASEFAEASQGVAQSYSSASYNLKTAGNTTNMPVTAQLGMNIHAVVVESLVSVTGTGATTTVAGTDVLDLTLLNYEVTNQVGGGVRCKTLTRLGSEEVERLYVQPPTTTSFIYPRASATTFTAGGGTTTYQLIWVIPASGGTSLNVKVYWPGAAQVFTTSANISAMTTTFNLYAVPTLATFKTAFQEINTRVLGAGQQDISSDIPAGMAPDLVEFPGTAWGSSSTTISKVVIDGQGGIGRSVDFEDQYVGNALQTVYPQSSAANQTNILLNMHKKKADHMWVTTGASWSAALPILFCELDDGVSLVESPEAAPLAAPALADMTGQSVPGAPGPQPSRHAGRQVAPNTAKLRKLR